MSANYDFLGKINLMLFASAQTQTIKWKKAVTVPKLALEVLVS